MKRALLALSLCSLVSGCSSAVRYYSLQPSSTAGSDRSVRSGPAIEFREVRFPAYLNNPQMVLRKASGEMRVDEYHRWVEDLQPNFERTLLADVSSLARSSAVFTSGASDVAPAYVVQLDVTRFEVADDGSVQLWTSYTISEPGTKVGSARSYVDTFSAPVNGGSTDARVQALSGLVGELARGLVGRLMPNGE